MHCQGGLYQFKHWFGGPTCLLFLESFVKEGKTLLDLFPGSLWKLLKSQASRTVVQPQEPLEEEVAQPKEPLEEEDLLEVLVGDDTASELFEDD